MKATGRCPKCAGRRFLVNDRVGFQQKLYKTEELHIAALPVVARIKVNPGGFFGPSRTVEEVGHYESSSCCGCGFTELYAHDLQTRASDTGRIVDG